MLIQFKFKNHKCFYQESILDMIATQEKRHIDSTIDINGNKLLPVVAIHGANASGKSSTLDALFFMFKTIKDSSNVDVNAKLNTAPFAFGETTQNENSEYEVSLSLGDYEYRYGFSLNTNGIDEEWLYQKKFTLNTRTTQKLIFERQKDKTEFGKKFTKYENVWKLFNDDTDSSKLLILSNVARKDEQGILRSIYDFVGKFSIRVESAFQTEASIDILSNDHELFTKFQKIIRKFDPCLLGIRIDEVEKEDNKKQYRISGIHQSIDNEKSKVLLPLRYESDGTIKIFSIMPTILRNLEQGGLLCIDELDVKLHPLLFKSIVDMYKDREINKNNAQLIFTAHSTFMFNSDNLRRDQIYLVEKNSFGQSRLYSICEFRNVRVDADYEKKYLTGSFGAIPYQNE